MLNIQSMPSPNWSARDGAKPLWIVMHGTAGFETAQEVAVYFASQASQVAAHYVVGLDGTIIRCVEETKAAWSNGPITGPPGTSGDGVHHDAWWDNAPQWFGVPNPNPVTISIEHVKPSIDNSDILTPAQQAASFALILDICKRQRIPMRAADAQGGITGHYSMDPVNRSNCPGPYPWAALWAYLQQGGTMVPQGWSDNGSVLTAPKAPDGKQYTVSQGFRTFILGSSWDPTNVPVEQEHGLAAGGTQQTFLKSALGWTAQTGVVIADLGQQYLAAQSQVAALQAQIAAAPSTQIITKINSDLQAIAASAADAETSLARL